MRKRSLLHRLQRVRDSKVTGSAGNVIKDQLDRLRNSANDASQLARRVYLSFLVFCVYIAILVGSTTHEQLLRGIGAKLPVLQVELPIDGTYVVVPLIFLFFHLNLLILLYLLSQKLHAFEGHIEKLPEEQQDVERRLLYPFPFSQMLVGKYRGWLDRSLFAVMVKSTLIVFPIALLLWTQVRFLPYHSILITWIHRSVVLGDLLLLLVLWPKIRAPSGRWLNWLGGTSKYGPVWKRIASAIFRICFFGALGLVVAMFSVSLATIPEEWIEEKIGQQDLTKMFDQIRRPFHRNLILGEATLVREAPPPELLATYERMEKETDLAWLNYAKGLDLRGRDLRFADFFKANLTKADLRKAKLQSADLREAELQGANLGQAELQGANLWLAELQGADLGSAELQGADLRYAKLQGADLREAELQGADLRLAELQGANLRFAKFHGANLRFAKFHGANLKYAELQGANLLSANLQGAELGYANLQGADLWGAKLQGAHLKWAELQGADLRRSRIGGTDFRAASVHLSDLRGVDCTPLTSEDWQELREEVEKTVPKGELRSDALKRLEEAEKRVRTTFPAVENAKNVLYDHPEGCHEWPVPYLNGSDYDRELAQSLFNLACSNKYVAQGIARRVTYSSSIIGPERTIWPNLAKKLVESDCKAVQQLPKDVLERLEKVAKKAR